ncbi:hypothetical protein [Bartonella sp. CB12SXKL]|uniref:hypothetical protein n=1 Tax=Bartonella sp. CB12SXKL TaxID=3243510 RepID=UPI0035D1011B
MRFDTSLLFHKRKDGDAKWTYHYIIHRCRREMSLGAVKDAFLNQHMNWQLNGVLFYLKDL